MSAYDLRLRDIAKQIRLSRSDDIDAVEQQRCDAASIIRGAIADRALRIPDLASRVVDVGWHFSAIDINNQRARQFFSDVAQWAFFQYRKGLFPAGRVRNEVADYATVCDLIADIIERDAPLYLTNEVAEKKNFAEVADEYCQSLSPDSTAVFTAIWRLLCYEPLTQKMATLVAMFAEADQDGLHNNAAAAVFRLGELILSADERESGDQNAHDDAHSNAHQSLNRRAPVSQNGSNGKKHRVWDDQCKTLLNRWIRRMEAKGWIPLATFIANELPALEKQSEIWKGQTARRFTQKFTANKDQWEPLVARWNPKK